VSSADALKHVLLDAESVVYNKASTGLYLEKLFDRLGVGAQVKGKETRYPDGAAVMEHVIHGKGKEIGFGAITEIKLYGGQGRAICRAAAGRCPELYKLCGGAFGCARQPRRRRGIREISCRPGARAAFLAKGVE